MKLISFLLTFAVALGCASATGAGGKNDATMVRALLTNRLKAGSKERVSTKLFFLVSASL